MSRKAKENGLETIPPTEPPTTLIPAQGMLLQEAMNGDIEEWAIQERQGPGGRMLKYIPHGYVRDQLNRVFGPFWSETALDVKPGCKYDIVYYENEREDPRTHVKTMKPVREIIVMTELRIRIYSNTGELLSEETHPGAGGKIWENNIAFADALQSAQSEALKRAAFSLGRKFGLQLYYDDDERRAEWQERMNPPAPKTFGELVGRMKRDGISPERWEEVTGKPLSEIEERDISELWSLWENRAE